MDMRMQLDTRDVIQTLLDEGWTIVGREPELLLKKGTEVKTEHQVLSLAWPEENAG